jgi:hypothetical protein
MSYVALSTITLTGTDSEIVFSSIPGTYRDLVLVVEAATTESGVTLDIRFNGDTGSNYSSVEMTGRNNGTVSGGGSDVHIRVFGNTFGTTTFQSTMHIMDYAQTNKHKPVLVRNSSFDTSLSSYLVKAFAGRWGNTSAVTSISLASLFNSRSFAAGSRFSLYGVAG